jgi:hypothetical protein
MMKRNLMLAVLAPIITAMTAASVAPAIADEQKGEVQEIIIKIQTPDGPRWYSLGTDLSKIDIRKGAVVRFNYADDTIESIDVEEVAPGDPPATTQ